MSDLPDPQLSIVLPVYNERPTILEVLDRVRALPIAKEIIIVDNCSTRACSTATCGWCCSRRT